MTPAPFGVLLAIFFKMIFFNGLLEKYSAIIFDYDGTIVDSNGLHQLAYVETCKTIGIDFVSAEICWQGRSTKDVIEEILLFNGMHTNLVHELVVRKREAFGKLAAERRLSPMADIVDLLKRCKVLGKRCYIASGSGRKSVTHGIDSLGMGHFFEATYCIEDVVSGKPSPELFNLVLHDNQLFSEDCLVIEDSEVGFIAAERCGLAYVDVADISFLVGDKN